MRIRSRLLGRGKLSASLCAAGLVLCGCLSPLRFGATDLKRVEDTNGVPTYFASGRVNRGDQAEAKVAKMMPEACPGGDPRLVDGLVITTETLPRRLWTATFTCNDVIPLD